MLATLWLFALLSGPPLAEPPDLVVLGRVYTLNWGEPLRDGAPAADAPFTEGQWSPDAEALAIRQGRIVAVGSRAEILALRGPATRVLESRRKSKRSARVAERAAATPADEWIVGHGWDEGAWANRYPDMAALSEG